MTDLHNKARALLALRDKATPGPWIYVYLDEWSHSVVTQHGDCPDGEPIYWTVASINKNREPEHEANARLIATAHDMIDTIAELLAENERLAAALSVAKEIILKLDADRAAVYARAEAAEAQYRALCEADPVAWRAYGSGHWNDGLPSQSSIEYYGANLQYAYATPPAPSVPDDVPDDVAKDAARYRWLRSRDVGPSQVWELLADDCQPPYMTLKHSADLDAAIDAAMLAAAPEPPRCTPYPLHHRTPEEK